MIVPLPYLDTLILTSICSVYTDFEPWIIPFAWSRDKCAGVTSQQGMLTPLRHLIPPLVLRSLFGPFSDCISFRTYDWLIDYLLFYVPLKIFSIIGRRHHCRWRTAKFRPMVGAQGLWVGRDLYRATSTVTRGLGFPVSSEGPPHSDTWGDV
jgi:hypothetical protein